MPKYDAICLRHMLDAALEVMRFTRGKSRDNLETDRQLVLALAKSIEIIGEAASKISLERRKLMPRIPWENIIGMRNRLIHAYFDIDLNILWKTIIEDIPPLIMELGKAIPPNGL